MSNHSHLSIGEVLSLLQEEFPDVTISKIRFLESQGLLDPERTPSGYRKFYESDIDQLRWILTQQKENFLPLKVIKDRLAERSAGGAASDAEPSEVAAETTPPIWMADAARAAAARAGEVRPSLFDPPAADEEADVATTSEHPAPAPAAADQATPSPAGPASAKRPVDAPSAAAPPAPGPSAARSSARESAGSPAPVPVSPSPVAPPPPPPPAERRAATPLDVGPTSVSLTFTELASASGLAIDQLRELEGYGLIEGRSVGSDTYYDGNALVVAQKSAGFIARGIEPRHLRMFKVAAEREAGFLEQVVMPMVKQRNPAAREQAVGTLGELASLGQGLRAALLRHALRDYLG